MDRTGTVHKTQGKEATVVILVLGGNIKSGGRKPGRRKTQSSERRGKQGETTHLCHRRACIMGEATLLSSTLSRALGRLDVPVSNSNPRAMSYMEEYLTTEWR